MKESTHKHKCDKCGYVWEHEENCFNKTQAHTCKCGEEQWRVYFGPAQKPPFISCAAMPVDATPELPFLNLLQQLTS